MSLPAVKIEERGKEGGNLAVVYRSGEQVPANFDDIVFENRNRDYGAYVLRRKYLGNVYRGAVITVLVVAFLVSLPSLLKWIKGDQTQVVQAPRKMVYSELSAPPPIDRPKPPPPQVQLPKLQKVIKFVPPKVVKEQVVEELPTIEEIKVAEIGPAEVEGIGDIVFDEPVAEIVEESDEIFMIVEQQPEFMGGYEAMMLFIQKHMNYPPMARKLGLEGTVHISFVVAKNGDISDVQILRGISADIDKEAVRVVSMMPPWKPGLQNGKAVNVRFIMPLKFSLN